MIVRELIIHDEAPRESLLLADGDIASALEKGSGTNSAKHPLGHLAIGS